MILIILTFPLAQLYASALEQAGKDRSRGEGMKFSELVRMQVLVMLY